MEHGGWILRLDDVTISSIVGTQEEALKPGGVGFTSNVLAPYLLL